MVVFDEKVSKEDRIDSIISTASIPVVFPNINIGHHTLIDGYIYVNLALTEAILKCREFGFDDKDIIVDIVLCSGQKMELREFSKRESEYLNAYDIYARKNELQFYYGVYEDILRVMRGYPEVQFRHLIAPTVDLHSNFFTDGREKVEEMMN